VKEMKEKDKALMALGGIILGAIALAPLAYFGATFGSRKRCPHCDGELDILKRPGKWDPDVEFADSDD
jgi:hypothetical protein